MILLSASLTSFLQLLGVLVIFVFVLGVTYIVTKWIGGFEQMQMSGKQFKVIDSVRIAGNKYAQILKVGDVYLVIAVGKDEVTMLAKLTAEEIGLTGEALAGVIASGNASQLQGGFQEILDSVKGRFSKKQD